MRGKIAAEAERILGNVGEAMQAWASEELLPLAIEFTPEATGTLKQSARVGDLEWDGRRLSVTLGYTDPKAVEVHERTNARHEIGQAKFLEAALMESARTMLPGIVERLGSG